MSDDWWRHAVIYQVYVRSFADSNGDGVGDLPGIRSRLPYLRDLGVDAVWITPFYASPMADGGYDVADYRAVDPQFGGLDDVRALVDDAHTLGIRVIVDIVPNHTSDQHAWFQEALAGNGRERYMFREGIGDGPPNDWESVFGGPAWTQVADGSWYLHLFAPEQPDLNWELPEVRAEFRDVLRFWLDLGVDGFRVDVAHGMIKAPGLPDIGHTDQLKLLGTESLPFFDQDGVHEIHREWRAVVDTYPGERVLVAEAWTPSAERTAMYLRADEMHQAFNFHYLSADWTFEAVRSVIDSSLAAVEPVGAPTTWVLSNHDVQRHVTRYGGGETGVRRARAALALMLALPGSVYLYQGEELGLPEVLDLPDEVLQDPMWERSGHTERGRDGCRVPLPWAASGPSLGFGTGGSWLPQPADWAKLSVETQTGDQDSMLSFYRTALRARRENPASSADLTWVDGPDGVLWFERDGLACAVNLSEAVVELPDPGSVLLASSYYGVRDGLLLLPPDTALWWKL